MPAYSSKIKIQATKSYGAEVILCETRLIADEMVKAASEEAGCYWIPPFNHEQVITGQGTAVYEAMKHLKSVDAVFAPCGGGGLLSGSMIAAKGLNPETKLIGAEPLLGNDAAQSLRAGKIIRLDTAPDTLADGAQTLAVGDITFEYLKKLDEMYEIPERDIIYWAQWLPHLLKIRVEPTCAMAMEAARQWLGKQKSPKKILVVISGGNIDQQMQTRLWKENMLEEIPALS
jgi:threonine dehydratase